MRKRPTLVYCENDRGKEGIAASFTIPSHEKCNSTTGVVSLHESHECVAHKESDRNILLLLL